MFRLQRFFSIEQAAAEDGADECFSVAGETTDSTSAEGYVIHFKLGVIWYCSHIFVST